MNHSHSQMFQGRKPRLPILPIEIEMVAETYGETHRHRRVFKIETDRKNLQTCLDYVRGLKKEKVITRWTCSALSYGIQNNNKIWVYCHKDDSDKVEAILRTFVRIKIPMEHAP